MDCGNYIIPLYLSTSSRFYNFNIKSNKHDGHVNFYGGRVKLCALEAV